MITIEPDPFRRPAIARREHTLVAPVDSVDAFDPEKISRVESIQERLASSPFAVGVVTGVASSAAFLGVLRLGLWFVKLPDGTQRQAAVALVLFPLAVAASAWAWRKLR